METQTDPLVVQYEMEIRRISRKISGVKARLKRAKRPATRKRLSRTLYTLYVNRGQLRQTLEYITSTWRRHRLEEHREFILTEGSLDHNKAFSRKHVVVHP